MDSLYWLKINPKIICESTRKQFYNRFCYKLVVEAYGARSVNDATPNEYIANHIDERKAKSKQYNYSGSWSNGGSWAQRQLRELNKADPTMLEEIRSMKNGYGNQIKVRIEEPWVQFYTQDEQTLRDVAARLTYDPHNAVRLLSVSIPDSLEHQLLLEQGIILTGPASKIEHKYRVYMRDGTYGREIKSQVAAYFESLGDEIKISKGNMSMLKGHLQFIWGCQFYTNDPAIATMLSLIAPGIVRKIHEIVKV
jgi:hypothetical protein